VAENTPTKLDAREETFCKLAAKHKVRTRLAELFLPVIAKAQMMREQWLGEVAKCALFDVRWMFDEHGHPKDITELDDTEAAAIRGFELYEDFQGTGESRKLVGYTKKFKFTDRLRALELYGKACGYYDNRQELSGPDGRSGWAPR
jgi:hypothetical protein